MGELVSKFTDKYETTIDAISIEDTNKFREFIDRQEKLKNNIGK